MSLDTLLFEEFKGSQLRPLDSSPEVHALIWHHMYTAYICPSPSLSIMYTPYISPLTHPIPYRELYVYSLYLFTNPSSDM